MLHYTSRLSFAIPYLTVCPSQIVSISKTICVQKANSERQVVLVVECRIRFHQLLFQEEALNRTNLLAGVVFENVDVEEIDFSYKIRPSAEARTVSGIGKPSLGWLTGL